jgi:hypothetical protein
MSDDPKFQYGFSHDLFVTRKPGGDALVVGCRRGHFRWTAFYLTAPHMCCGFICPVSLPRSPIRPAAVDCRAVSRLDSANRDDAMSVEVKDKVMRLWLGEQPSRLAGDTPRKRTISDGLNSALYLPGEAYEFDTAQ